MRRASPSALDRTAYPLPRPLHRVQACSPPPKPTLDPMTDQPRPFWIAGKQATGTESYEVYSPYDGAHVATVSMPTDQQVEEAVAAAYAAAKESAGQPAYVRAAAL